MRNSELPALHELGLHHVLPDSVAPVTGSGLHGKEEQPDSSLCLAGQHQKHSQEPQANGGGPHAEAVGSYAKDEEVRSVHSEGL